MPDINSAIRKFRKIGITTIIAVFVLILVGGIVRSTGSGMGCPDWPKCFGNWVPPTNAAQLPADYLEVYKNKRIEKNQKLGKMLSKMGFSEAAENIFNHPASHIETEFNVTKTWIEYVNRLVGVAIGIFIFLTVLYALPLYKKDKTIFWLSFISFIVVGIQGWLGSIVVSTNLLPETVTVHMALALVLIALLIYAVARTYKYDHSPQNPSAPINLLWVIAGLTGLTFIQIMLGTQVREEVDRLAFNLGYAQRETWIEQLGSYFLTHRSFSILMLVANIWAAYKIFSLKNNILTFWAKGMLFIIGLEIVAGVGLAYVALPPFLQPVHLFLGTLLFGVQFYIFIAYFYATKQPKASPHLELVR